MNVLVLGSGGREHAFGWKIAQSSILTQLFIAPGNAGTAQVGTNVNVDYMDFKALKKFVLEKQIHLVVVGPEAPLVAGIADFFAADPDLKSVGVVGPTARAAMLEGSKDYAKQFMKKYNVPTARYHSFTKDTLKQGVAFLATLKAPYVLKADGLAAGKGVVICPELKEAEKVLAEMLNGKFGAASDTVVIEEFLKGIEMSVFVITDGVSYKILPEAKDYKRIGEGDTGPNTGGMGAISPVSFASPEFLDKIESQVIIPTMKGLKAEGIDYRGFVFFGIIKVGNEPYVIEYNCRMGDPETEVVLPRIKSDLLTLLEGVTTGTLGECDVQVDGRTAAAVMLVSKGYPGEYEKGKEIKGLEGITGSLVFHAGTRQKNDKVVTNGGRVIAVTSMGNDVDDATARSFASAEKIHYPGRYYRSDIGFDLKGKMQKA